MTLEVLMSCMHQSDDVLIRKSHITSDAVMINQCDKEAETTYATANGTVRMYSTVQRGLTKSRNLAISRARADICLLCDDDEIFVPDYESKILNAYRQLSDADIIIFKMVNRASSFPDRIMRLRFPKTMKVSSWQISFRLESLLRTGIRFDELLGAGTGNGAEEELKFLRDCEKAKLKIYYFPCEIASVAQAESTWFSGFNETFFENRGATTRYILGFWLAFAYAIYYILRKRHLYKKQISTRKALCAIMRGIRENQITKLAM